jgi:DNA adenine methylase
MAEQNISPLRYPGGKASLAQFLIEVIKGNDVGGGTYVEAYAGGAGAALSLLVSDYVYQVYLNDKDVFVYSFWQAVFRNADELCRLIKDTSVSIEEWERQRSRMRDHDFLATASVIEIAFCCFFLNRTNRSGILNAGPIGGKQQLGNYPINARYNKVDLIKRINRLALYENRVKVFNMDAISFLNSIFNDLELNDEPVLIYLDPPYHKMGKEVYRHYYTNDDHRSLASFLQKATNYKWLLSYDDTELINSLYVGSEINYIDLNYFANKVKVGRELFISSNNLHLPGSTQISNNQKFSLKFELNQQII